MSKINPENLIDKGRLIQEKFEKNSEKINYIYKWNNDTYSFNDNLLNNSNKKIVECKMFIFITSVYDYKNKNHLIATLYEKKDFYNPRLQGYLKRINQLVNSTADPSSASPSDKKEEDSDDNKFIQLQPGLSTAEKDAAEESLCHNVIGALNLKGFVLLNKIDPNSKKSVGNKVYFLVYDFEDF